MNGIEYFGFEKLRTLCENLAQGRSYTLFDYDGLPLMGSLINGCDEHIKLQINEDEALYNPSNQYIKAFYDDRRKTMITIVYAQKGIYNTLELLINLNLFGSENKIYSDFDMCHEEDLFASIENLKNGDVVLINNRNNLILFSSIWNSKVVRYVHFFKSRLADERDLIRHNIYSAKDLRIAAISCWPK